MELSAIVLCGPGKIRSENQDNYYLNGVCQDNPSNMKIQRVQSKDSFPALYAVADGMGGESHGELAALTAVSSLDMVDPCSGAKGLSAYLQDRNRDICRMIRENGGSRSGAAFVGLCLYGDNACVVNIGDCRAYLLREDRLTQLSQDHTAVRSMVELGVLTPEAARRHSDRHKLTQHLGIFPEEMVIEPYAVEERVRPGDMFLLCSDGLYDMVEDSDIQEILTRADDVQTGADSLFDVAMDNGGKDNLTVLIVKIEK